MQRITVTAGDECRGPEPVRFFPSGLTARTSGIPEGRCHDVYFAALMLSVAAYAFTGRGFAYAGIPPIFPGEVLLCAGIWTRLWPRPSAAAFARMPNLLLVALMIWTLARTLPYVGQYGVDAARDSVIVMYGLFGFVVTNLVLAKPSRIDRAMGWAGRFFTA